MLEKIVSECWGVRFVGWGSDGIIPSGGAPVHHGWGTLNRLSYGRTSEISFLIWRFSESPTPAWSVQQLARLVKRVCLQVHGWLTPWSETDWDVPIGRHLFHIKEKVGYERMKIRNKTKDVFYVIVRFEVGNRRCLKCRVTLLQKPLWAHPPYSFVQFRKQKPYFRNLYERKCC